jgi:hypothetical protein
VDRSKEEQLSLFTGRISIGSSEPAKTANILRSKGKFQPQLGKYFGPANKNCNTPGSK